MKKIEIVNAYADGDTIHYEVREDHGLGLFQKETVHLFIRYHHSDGSGCDFSLLPQSILILPISLYLIPITYFYNVELVVPEMDHELFDRLPQIYRAYSKLYGPFQEDWRGKVSVKKVVKNQPIGNAKYDKVVFFSGGVDACHAGINNPGRRTLLVSIPDIESQAKNEGPLREEKFSLIKNFAKAVESDWLLISNNFNACLYRDQEINSFLKNVRGLSSPAFKFDGWGGIKYAANMCCVAPVAYLNGIRSLIMGSTNEEIEGKYAENLDGASPTLTNTIAFANVSFAEQEGLCVRRTRKVRNIIDWSRAHGTKVKMWVCFSDRAKQCCSCVKCLRTQLNILCVGENPLDWGFEDFSEKKFLKCIKTYQYRESTPCWLWDSVDVIDDKKIYPCLNKMLHWLKKIGYKEYIRRSNRRANPSILTRFTLFDMYPHYCKAVAKKLFGR